MLFSTLLVQSKRHLTTSTGAGLRYC